MARWYYEKMSPMGRWAPQVSSDEPSAKSALGPIKMRGLVKIEDDTLTFDEILKLHAAKVEVPAWATHRHVKTGKFYTVTSQDRLEVTGDEAYPLTEYQDAAGRRYAQNAARFNDGRFEAVQPTAA